jgi:hypothetical protein
VRAKVVETLTRRSAGTGRNGDARVGYLGIRKGEWRAGGGRWRG